MLLNRLIANQQSKRGQAHSVCLQEVQKYKKVVSVNKQNEYETTSKKWTDKEKTDLTFVNVFKFQEKMFKIVQKNFWEIQIILIKERWSSHDKYGQSKAGNWQ